MPPIGWSGYAYHARWVDSSWAVHYKLFLHLNELEEWVRGIGRHQGLPPQVHRVYWERVKSGQMDISEYCKDN